MSLTIYVEEIRDETKADRCWLGIQKGRLHITGSYTLHNHPSGDPSPSGEDINITKRLKETGDLIGIRVLDHIIIGDGQYVSFVERGLL